MTKQIGQLRFTGKGCVTPLNFEKRYQSVSSGISGMEDNQSSFQDVVIIPKEQAQGGKELKFLKDNDYYFYFAVPKDLNYDIALSIKLIKKQDNLNQVYQFIKPVTVQKGNNGNVRNHNVVLYEKSDGSVDAMIPLPYVEGQQSIKDKLYFVEANDQTKKKTYYLGTGTTEYIKTNKFNSVIISESWKQDYADDKNRGVFEMVFRPVEDGFDGILLEMLRLPEDFDIQTDRPDGTTIYGRIIDINRMDVKLYHLSNVVKNIFGGGANPIVPLDRIGIWGHPSQLMAINGEEIRIGRSGYYEQDVVPIKSIGMVAPNDDFVNNWTIDYSYEVPENID